MFILSYFRKKPIIKVKEDTLENLDDDFIVISDNLNSISIEKNEDNVKNIVDCSEENDNLSCSTDTSILNSTTFSAYPQDKGDEENEENQLIENTKEDNYQNLSFCDKIIKDVITFIFGDDVIRKIKLAHNL